MPYAERDGNGRIVALHLEPWEGADEHVTLDDPEVWGFLHSSRNPEHAKRALYLSDVELSRVLEDLIEVLVDKHVILLTELPEPAQRKVRVRQRLRAGLNEDAPLLKDGGDIL